MERKINMELTDVLAAAKVTGKAIGAVALSLYTIGTGEVALSKFKKSQREIKEQLEKGELKVALDAYKRPQLDLEDLGFTDKIKKAVSHEAKRVVNTGRLGLHKSVESMIFEEQKELLRKQNANVKQVIEVIKNKE